MMAKTSILAWAILAACSSVLAAAPPDERALVLGDDQGSYVDVSGTGVQITGKPISVQAWFRTTGKAGHIFETGMENRGAGQSQAGYALYTDFGGKVRFGVNSSFERFSQAQWDDATTRQSYNDGQWHHVTGVFPADGRTRVRIFLDAEEVPEEGLQRAGAPQAPLTRYTQTVPPSRIGARTGGRPGSTNACFAGRLDEFRVWNVALTPEQIADNYRKRVPANTPGLVAQWPFDPGDGLLDDAVGGHRGKLQKAPPPPKAPPPLPLAHDYSKYPGGLTGYTGYDRNQIAHWTLKPAARQRVGTRGLGRPTIAKLADGTLICRVGVYDSPEKPGKTFRSEDRGATWTECAPTAPVPSGEKLPTPAPNASVVRLDETNLIAAMLADGNAPFPGVAPPRGTPAPKGDRSGEHSVLVDSTDGGATWGKPRPLLGYSQTDAHLTKLRDGRLLCTFHNMHVSFGAMAILSDDAGRTWDKEHPVFLARAWGPAGGRPSSVQLDDGTIVTVYCIQAYRGEGRDTVVESVRWQLPARGAGARGLAGVTDRATLTMEPADYGKYPAHLYGYSGVDRLQVAYMTLRPAVRVTIGHRGFYKGALAKLRDGTLVATPCFNRPPRPIQVYRSTDGAASWQFAGAPGHNGKEQGAAVLQDGTLLTLDFYGRAIYRSTDGGLSWEYLFADKRPPGIDRYTGPGIAMMTMARSVIENGDGSLIWIGGTSTYANREAPPARAWRIVSRDRGSTWGEAREVPIRKDAEGMFDEAAMIRLPDGRILAASRVTDSHLHGGKAPARPRPGHGGEDADHMVLVESSDDGLTWTEPRDFLNYSRVHAELVRLADGRLLSCYAAYHLPLGVFAVLSEDDGRTWSVDNPIQLAISTRVYTGWPTSVQLDDGSIVTMYAAGHYVGKKDFTVAESVRWTLPPK